MEGITALITAVGLSGDSGDPPLLSKFLPSLAGLNPLLGGVTLLVTAKEFRSLGTIHVSRRTCWMCPLAVTMGQEVVTGCSVGHLGPH